MRKFTDSDIYQKMNTGNAITNQIQNTIQSINANTLINGRLDAQLMAMNRVYRDALTTRVIEAVKDGRILILCLPMDKRLPANMPYVKVKRSGKQCVIVDMSKYVIAQRGPGAILEEFKVDVAKLYSLLVPAYLALEVINEFTVMSSETTKLLSLMWAKLFNKVLMNQKIFVGNRERYEAFMYFAMRFFMIYYCQIPIQIVDNISGEYINGVKSKYISTIENNLQHKGIDLYADWNTFARTMFSNEITNIRAITNVDMNVDQYLRLFSTLMGRDGSYLSLWSTDYAFYCFFVTWCHSWILNDRSFDDIVNEDPKLMPKILRGLVKEL